MDYNDKFNNDLFIGEAGERVLSKYFKLKDWNTINFNKDNKYDLLIEKDGMEIYLEIKTDCYEYYKNITTNNMFIEVRCNGKNSGLSATKADYFIYYYPFHEIFYLIKVSKLKSLMVERGDLFRRTERCGDKGKVTGYIINRLNNDFFKTYDIDLATFQEELDLYKRV